MKKIITACKMLALTAAATAGATALAEASAAKKKQIESYHEKIFDVKTAQTVTVNFAKGSSDLTDAEKAALRNAAKGMQDKKRLDKAVVAVWADQAMPRGQGQALSDAEVELADKRLNKIEDVLDKADVDNTDAYNMSKGSNWLQDLLETDTAEVKQAVKTGRDTPDPRLASIADTLKRQGGPGKAVVIFVDEQESVITTRDTNKNPALDKSDRQGTTGE